MKIIRTEIPDVLILEPKVFADSRGYFFESFSKRELEEALGKPIDFVQDNQSMSQKGVVRGLHFQQGEHAQAKLVRCVSGKILDTVVDLRPGSPTFSHHVSVELSGDNFRSLFIPRGFAHGFSVLSDTAVFQYKCDNYYCPESEAGIFAYDGSLNINWGISFGEAIMSEKDKNLPLLFVL